MRLQRGEEGDTYLTHVDILGALRDKDENRSFQPTL
jgi:hypothetical protein